MIGFTIIGMVLVLIVLLCIILVGGRHLRNSDSDSNSGRPPKWPEVSIIVPATGAAPELEDSIRSLLTQDYPAYRVVFVTRDSDDPASSVIGREIARDSRACMVHSGRATGCGQKNHSLLRGLEEVGEDSEILVFCDSTRLASPGWLKQLASPVAMGEALVASGYHHVFPLDHRIATLGRACSVLLLLFTKDIPGLNQPWGGGTAIDRETFQRLNVAGLWSRKVVDDVSLAAELTKGRIHVASSPNALLITPVGGETLVAWNQWLIRQWLYLKFCLPCSWLLGGIACYIMDAFVIFSVLACAFGVVGGVGPAVSLPAALFLVLLAGLGWLARRYHPKPGPGLPWLGAFFASLLMWGWSHMETLFTRHVNWRGIRYKVAWGGDVLEIRENIRQEGKTGAEAEEPRRREGN